MSRLVSIFRLVVLPLLAAVTLGLAAPAASAATVTKLNANLAALWTTVLQTPSAQNSFGTGGDAFACWNLGGTVAPFSPSPSGVPSCTVKPGTRIFVAASSFECSTFEGNGTTEAELQACAEQNDAQTAPTVTVDGRPVPVTEAETGLLHIVLPADNIFLLPAGATGLSFGHGWVSLLNPLTPGTHTIVIHRAAVPDITTTIIVTPGR
jgi:hypothetical protein